MTGIYIIKNKRTHEVYVGESRDIESRWKRHKYELRKGTHHSEKLQKAWNKYGESAFTFKVAERFIFTNGIAPEKIDVVLYLREEYYMDKYNSLNFGYNVENTIGSLLRYYDTGRGRNKFHKYKKYKKFCMRHLKLAQHRYCSLIVACAYNKRVLVVILCLMICLLQLAVG